MGRFDRVSGLVAIGVRADMVGWRRKRREW
jgi:hypothetical protein